MAALAATVLAAGFALLLWLGVVAGAGDITRFEVRDQDTQEVAYARDIEVGATFTLEHTHSVTRRRVVETFSVPDESTVAIEELWFDEFGANLPAGSEQIGDRTTTFMKVEDGYRVLHHGQVIGSLPLLVGSAEVDHVVTFEDGERLRLLDVSRAGSKVELAVGATGG